MADHLELKEALQGQSLTSLIGKAFKSTDEELPKEVSKLIVRKLSKLKKAGTASNQRAAASTAWILQYARHQFEGATMAWTGTRMGHIIMQKCSVVNLVKIFFNFSTFY